MWRLGKRKKTRIAAALLLAGMLALWAYTCGQARELMDAYAGLSVRIADTPVPGRKLKRLLAQEAEAGSGLICTAAWTRGEPTEACAPGLELTAPLRVAAVYGDMRQATPLKLHSGSLPTEDDFTGCLLDETSAWALFRSTDVTGAQVLLGDRAYTVRGVAACGEPLALIRSEDVAYENLEFAPADIETGKAEAEAFLFRHALSADYAVVQSGLYARILWGLVWLPAAALLLAACVRLLRGAFPREKRWRSAAACRAAGAVCCCALLALLIKKTFFWPESYLPTKCADLAFWGTLLDSWRENWRELSLMTPLPKDVLFFSGMRSCLWGTATVTALVSYLLLLTGRTDAPSQEASARNQGNTFTVPANALEKNGNISN